MSAGHTPGPWFFHNLPDGWCISTAKTRRAAGSHNAICGAEADYDPLWNEEPNEANARLIAAAPELLEASQSLLTNLLAGGLGSMKQIEALQAAIAKATGAA